MLRGLFRFLKKTLTFFFFFWGYPVVLIQADPGGERKVRAYANEHLSPLSILYIEVVLVNPAILGFQMPLLSLADRRHNAGRFARLDDHHYLVGLRVAEVGLDEVVAPVFGVAYDLRAPLPSAALDPVVILARNVAQDFPAHGINLPINPEKALRPGTVQEGLNTAVQKKTVKAPVTKLDAILMVLEKGVHGQPPVW